jgi:hypothetical protein
MAINLENSTCHLTPQGWVVGDTPPPDRVETWNCCVRDAGRGKRYVEWTRLWTNSDVALSERNRLRKRFWDVVDAETINQALGRPRAASQSPRAERVPQ